MSSPYDDSLIRAIELFKGSVVTSVGVIDLEESKANMIRVLEDVRSTDQVSKAVPSTSRPLRFLPVNPIFGLIKSDLLRITFQYGIPESVELRLSTPAERQIWTFQGVLVVVLTRLEIPGALIELSVIEFLRLGSGLADVEQVEASID
ncbi:hypothetical protein ACOSQ4_031958 [Xanthoceras sorbifolium]